MTRTIKTSCWVYASEKEIFKEWIFSMVEGSLAIEKRYIAQKEMIKHYGFAISRNGRCCINEIEAETVKDIFMMYLFGVSINGICEKLVKYQSKIPDCLRQWSEETVRDILSDESYTGYQFISENDTVAVMQVGWAIIPRKIFAVSQEMNASKRI
jgi:hypothetical protein